jgi:hypothetical protein
MDITDPNEILSTDRNKMIMKKLTSKFVGVCYNSCYILKINRIIRRSYIYMKDTLDGDAHTNVMFEVDAIEYIKDEIINGCKIIKKEPNGIIHAKSEYSGIQLNIQSNMSIFKEGDIIPVIVRMVRYYVNQSAISVLAVPFMPIVNPIQYYKINGVLTKQETDNIKSLLDQIKDAETQIDKLDVTDKKIYKFFNELLSNKEPSIKSGKKINISDIMNIKSGIVSKIEGVFDYSQIYYTEETDSKNTSDVIIEDSSYIIFSVLLIKYLCNLQTLQNFIKAYPKFTDIQQHKNTWKLYASLKK